MTSLLLVGAIVAEVAGTLALKAATTLTRRWYVVLVPAYAASFGLLTLALHEGLRLGVAYGVWTAAGVALTAVASKPLFGEPLSLTMAAGIALIMLGVLAIELGAA